MTRVRHRQIGPGRRVDGGFLCCCEGCGEEFVSRFSTARSCSNTCWYRIWKREDPEGYLEKRGAINRAARRRYYEVNRERLLATRDQYRRANLARHAERQRLRKAKITPGHPQFVERVDRYVVYAMHGGCCGICWDYIEPDDFAVDHRIPLSRGGLHGYVNTQPAHPLCNQRKLNKLPEEMSCP